MKNLKIFTTLALAFILNLQSVLAGDYRILPFPNVEDPIRFHPPVPSDEGTKIPVEFLAEFEYDQAMVDDYYDYYYNYGYYGPDGLPYIDIDCEDGSVYGDNWSGDVTDRDLANLIPGKTYSISVDGAGIEEYKLHFDAPPGWVVIFEDVRVKSYEDLGGLDFETIDYDIRVEKDEDLNEVMAVGSSSSLAVGKVNWKVGLGALGKERSAGWVSIRSDLIEANTYKRAGLIYDHERLEVEVIRDASGIRQIDFKSGFLDVKYISTEKYELRFYTQNQKGSKSGSVYLVSGTPFITYIIDNPNGVGNNTELSIKKKFGSSSSTWNTLLDYTSGSSPTWVLDDWYKSTGSVQREVTAVYTGSGLIETTTVRNGSSVVSSKTKNTYANKAWGRELVESVRDPDGEALKTTYDYHESSGSKGDYRKVKSITYPDGNWTRVDYYDDLDTEGQVRRRYGPWLDATSSDVPGDASDTVGTVTFYEYVADYAEKKRRVSSEITKVEGEEIAKATTTYAEDTYELDYKEGATTTSYPLVQATRTDHTKDASGTAVTEVTKTKYLREDAAHTKHHYPGAIYSIQRPDGTMESHAYVPVLLLSTYTMSYITYVTGTDYVEVIMKGSATTGTGYTLKTEWGDSTAKQTIESVYLVPDESTKAELYRHSDGYHYLTKNYIWNGSAWVYLGGDIHGRNNYGGITTRDDVVPTTTSPYYTSFVRKYDATFDTTWGTRTTEKDRFGTSYANTYDDAGRLATATKDSAPLYSGYALQTSLKTEYSYDASDRVTTRRTGSYPFIDVVWEYDKSGRLTKISEPGDGGLKATSYAYSQTYRTRTETLPNSKTRVQHWYRDGQLEELEGTGQVLTTFQHEVDPTNGLMTTQVRNEATTTELGANWSRTTIDWLGRVVKEEGAVQSSNSISAFSQYDYDSKGQLASSQFRKDSNGPTSGGALTDLLTEVLYYYSGAGNLSKFGMDVSVDGVLTANSSDDRVKYTTRDVVAVSSEYWLYIKEHGYSDNSGTPVHVLLSERRIRLTNYSSTNSMEIHTADTHGNVEKTWDVVDRTNKLRRIYVESPGATTDSEVVIYNGLKVEEKGHDGSVTDLKYDIHGRVSSIEGRDSVEQNFDYHTYLWGGYTYETYLVSKMSDNSNDLTFYEYDSMGRVIEEKRVNTYDDDLSTTRNEIKYTSYTDEGQLYRQWGNAANPVEYECRTAVKVRHLKAI